MAKHLSRTNLARQETNFDVPGSYQYKMQSGSSKAIEPANFESMELKDLLKLHQSKIPRNRKMKFETVTRHSDQSSVEIQNSMVELCESWVNGAKVGLAMPPLSNKRATLPPVLTVDQAESHRKTVSRLPSIDMQSERQTLKRPSLLQFSEELRHILVKNASRRQMMDLPTTRSQKDL